MELPEIKKPKFHWVLLSLIYLAISLFVLDSMNGREHPIDDFLGVDSWHFYGQMLYMLFKVLFAGGGPIVFGIALLFFFNNHFKYRKKKKMYDKLMGEKEAEGDI